jgi:hypothetical protein
MTPMHTAMVLGLLRKRWPDAVAEHRFAHGRRWRFDFAVPSLLVAVEINGAIWTSGRHSRGSGLLKEYEKMRAAAILGWRVLPFATAEIHMIPSLVAAAAAHELTSAEPP